MTKYIDFALVGELVVHGDVHYEDLKRLPAADVAEVQHGHWEKVDDNPYEYVGMCSVCRNEVKQPTCMLKPIYSYCPICGALMDKDKE